jgi:hypothetical protein
MSAKCFVKILLIEVLVILGWGKVFADTPDSALLAVENRNGLYFKWSVDGEQWHTINHCFLTSSSNKKTAPCVSRYTIFYNNAATSGAASRPTIFGTPRPIR